MTRAVQQWWRLAGLGGLCLLTSCAGPGSLGSANKSQDAAIQTGWDKLEARRLTESSSDQLAPSWSADGQSLIYQNNVDGNWELYSLNLADGRPSRITDSPAAEEDPSWSPDGRWILCTVHPPSLDADPPRDICLMDREGKQTRILAAHGADDWVPRFSLDGRFVIFLSDRVDERRDVADEERQCALFQLNLDDGSMTQLSEAGRLGGPVPTARGLALRLGPHSLGWLGATGIESALVDSTRMLGQPDWHESQGWTVSELVENQSGQLLTRGPTDSSWRALPLDGRDGDMTPVWSPDGNALAFSGRKDGQWDLFVRRQATPGNPKP